MLEISGTCGLGDAQYKSAQAELEILMTQEHLALLQKTRENLSEVLAAMNIEILRFRKVVDRAADGSMTSRLLVRWTKVLAITTSGLMLATLALLVYATL